MFKHARLVACVVLTSLTFIACGAPAATPQSAASSAALPGPTDKTEASVGTSNGPGASETVAAASASPIVAKHAKGDVRLDTPAMRVAACSEEAADFLLALGVQPVGFCSGRIEGAQQGAPFELPHFFDKAQLGNPVFLGGSEAPSLEEIVKLKPDLILITSVTEGVYDQLAQIAPTMLLDTTAPDYWTATLIEVGRAVGREAQAQEYLRQFERTAEQLRDQLVPTVSQYPDVLLIYSFAASDGTMVFNEQWSGAKLLKQLGFNIVSPDAVSIPDAGYAPVSPEILHDVKASTIVVIRPQTQDGSVPRYPIDDILDNLQDVRVIRQVIDSTRGSSAPLTDKLVLQDFARLLMNEATAEPSTTTMTRIVKHALGETEVPINPQRVVVLDTGALANALALGVKPVGAALYGSTDLLGYLGSATTGVADLGGTDTPNLETVVQIKPDLIIGSKEQSEAQYQQLSQIAPTVLAEADPSAKWKEYLRFVGGALGKGAEAEQLLHRYDQRVVQFKQQMGDRLAETEVSVFRSRPEGVDIYLKKTFVGTVLEEAGLPRPPAQDKTEPFSERISPELIPNLDADVIFWVRRNPKEAAGARQFMENPLWATLGAAKTKRVYEVPWDVWVAGWNITGANLILDDLFKFLLEEA